MKKAKLALPTIGLIAGTRIVMGVGLGILLAEKVRKKRRHTLGWTLFLAGAGTTVPLVMHVFGRREEAV